MRKFLGLMTALVMSTTMTTTVAQAHSSATTGGYAYDVSRYTMVSCDTLDDGHTFENQSWNNADQRGIVKDSADGSCTYGGYSTMRIKFRGCRDRLFDNCGPWRTW